MDSNIMSALFRDPVINRLAAGRTVASGSALPETLVAKVTAFKGELASLRWQGGILNASLDANVSAGETLLLKYSGLKQGRPHYRIMARLPAGAEKSELVARDAGEPVLFGLTPPVAGGKNALPALVRFLPRGKKGAQGSADEKPLLELFVDTDSFGLVLVKFFFHKGDRLECRFVVESEQAGKALQGEADKIVEEAGGHKEGEKAEPLQWKIGNLRRASAEALHTGGLNLNAKA